MRTKGKWTLALAALVCAVGCTCFRGTSLETVRWQAEIDRVAAAGGGIVRVPEGRHVVGGLFLKSNVSLFLEKGCVLEGSSDISDYTDIQFRYAEVREPWQAIVAAIGQTNVSVVGEGEIFGNGKAFPFGSRLGRARGMIFHRCKDVRVEGVFLRDLASWSMYFKESDGVIVRNMKVDSHANANNDGIDIDSRNVLVENCEFDADDDGVVLKSDDPDFVVENVEIRNCMVRSTCSAFKLGTASHGGFRNVHIHDCASEASPREWVDPATGHGVISKYRVECWPGSDYTPSLLSGIAIECVDGGCAEDITIRNVKVARAATPIFIRGGARRNRKFGGTDIELGIPFGRSLVLKNVLIENYTCRATSFTASSITGVADIRPTNITLRNVDITVPGAGEAGKVEIGKRVPEKADAYPESNMFDSRMLPAYGFYVRHADNVSFENVRVKALGKEFRPEIVSEDVTWRK